MENAGKVKAARLFHNFSAALRGWKLILDMLLLG